MSRIPLRPMSRTSLSTESRLTIAEVEITDPCPADLPAFSFDERQRFCEVCSKHVHHLTAMTPSKARELVDAGDDICIAYDVDECGEIVFHPSRRSGWWGQVLGFAAMGLAFISQTGCGDFKGGSDAQKDKVLQNKTDAVKTKSKKGGLRRRHKKVQTAKTKLRQGAVSDAAVAVWDALNCPDLPGDTGQ